MSKGDNSPASSRIACVIKQIADKRAEMSLIIDFGVIQADASLLTNTYPIPIPKSDYIVCRHLKSRNENTSYVTIGESDHRHTVKTREALQKGDRVLVAWVQNDAVVLDVIIPASDVL